MKKSILTVALLGVSYLTTAHAVEFNQSPAEFNGRFERVNEENKLVCDATVTCEKNLCKIQVSNAYETVTVAGNKNEINVNLRREDSQDVASSTLSSSSEATFYHKFAGMNLPEDFYSTATVTKHADGTYSVKAKNKFVRYLSPRIKVRKLECENMNLVQE